MHALRSWLIVGATTAAGILFATAAVPAAAQADSEGCRDGDLARLSGFYINECDPAGPGHYVFAEGAPEQRDIQGTKIRIAYALQENAAAPAATAILSQYAAMFRQRGWTVAASGDQRWIAAYRGTNPASAEWAQVETNGDANYQIVYVTGSGGTTGSAGQHYSLSCSGVEIGEFGEVQGLDPNMNSTEYHDSSGGVIRRVLPTMRKASEVTLSGGTLASRPATRIKRSVPAGDIETAAGAPQQCQVILHNEAGASLIDWQLHNARVQTTASGRGSARVRLTPDAITSAPGG